ncbi:hypothetical protein ACF3NT_12125 [Naumannella halotolerans]|uniref:hypothetical protein n=1 Tax=Naumannella halotolerans TaxID=993414 RepID=UPI00370DE297
MIARARTSSVRPYRVLAAVGLFTALFAFTAATAWALASPELIYHWSLSMISDLGAGSCFTTDGRWICSPRAAWFNAGLLAAGALLIITSLIPHLGWGPFLRLAVAAAGGGLIMVAAFPSDSAPGLHMAGAVLALPVAAGSMMISGIRGEATPPTTASHRFSAARLRALLSATALLVSVVHLFPQWRLRGAAELASLSLLFLVIVLEAWSLLVRSGAEVTKGRPDRRPAADRSAAPQHR